MGKLRISPSHCHLCRPFCYYQSAMVLTLPSHVIWGATHGPTAIKPRAACGHPPTLRCQPPGLIAPASPGTGRVMSTGARCGWGSASWNRGQAAKHDGMHGHSALQFITYMLPCYIFFVCGWVWGSEFNALRKDSFCNVKVL